MDKWKGKVILITGASKGIGRCMAKVFAGFGMQVVACARSADKLKELEAEISSCSKTRDMGGRVDVRECDVGKIDDVIALFDYVRSKYGTLHACISNAGMATSDYFLPPPDPQGNYDGNRETSQRPKIYAGWRQTLDVNVLGPAVVCKEAVNLMAACKVQDGVVVVVSSIAGLKAFILKFDDSSFFNHMYVASKFAITAATECLRLEMAQNPLGCGIRIVTLYPGIVKTSINDNFRAERGTVPKKGEEDFYAGFSYLEPEDVCQALLVAFTSAGKVQIDGIVVNPVQDPSKKGNFMIHMVMLTELLPRNMRYILTIISTLFYSMGFVTLAGLAYVLVIWRSLQIITGTLMGGYILAFFSPYAILSLHFSFIDDSVYWLVDKGHLDRASRLILKSARQNGLTDPFFTYETVLGCLEEINRTKMGLEKPFLVKDSSFEVETPRIRASKNVNYSIYSQPRFYANKPPRSCLNYYALYILRFINYYKKDDEDWIIAWLKWFWYFLKFRVDV